MWIAYSAGDAMRLTERGRVLLDHARHERLKLLNPGKT
jgi:hypothetical protein